MNTGSYKVNFQNVCRLKSQCKEILENPFEFVYLNRPYDHFHRRFHLFHVFIIEESNLSSISIDFIFNVAHNINPSCDNSGVYGNQATPLPK